MLNTSLKVGLEWAPGTDPQCKVAIGRLLKPGQILGLYRDARVALGTGDLVIVVTDDGPVVTTRALAVENLKRALGPRALEFRMAHDSAHKVVQLPLEDEAMWVAVTTRDQYVPPTVIWVLPYEVSSNEAATN